MIRPAPSSDTGRPGGTWHPLPWWTRPSGLNLFFLLPMVVVVFWAAGGDLSGVTVRAENYFSAPFIALCLSLLLVSAVGAWLGENLRQPMAVQCSDAALHRSAITIGFLVLATYLFWYRSMFFDLPVLVSILTGEYKPEREDIGRVTGITSLVNLAPVFFGLAGYLLFVQRVRTRLLIVLAVVLLVVTSFRAYIWSERLALIEALIPLALAVTLALFGSSGSKPTRRLWRWLAMLGPYVALPAVLALFAVTEYFRSWTYYEDRMSFWEFSVGRFVSYYYTSLNNGAAILETTKDWPQGTFLQVMAWLHYFPLGIGQQFNELMGLRMQGGFLMPDPAWEFLHRLGDPEFNTPSSFAAVTVDIGVPGALLYFFLAMFCGGILYTRYVNRDAFALMLYPAVLVALFESLRYPYFGTSRAFVWLLGAVVVIAVLWTCGALGTTRPTRHAIRGHAPT